MGRIAYVNGRFVPQGEAVVHIEDRGYQFADAVYEVWALFDGKLADAEGHFARLREGRPESIETSSLHLDILRDLKRIHSHICSVAYPVLEATGELQSSRLKETVRRRRVRPAQSSEQPQ